MLWLCRAPVFSGRGFVALRPRPPALFGRLAAVSAFHDFCVFLACIATAAVAALPCVLGTRSGVAAFQRFFSLSLALSFGWHVSSVLYSERLYLRCGASNLVKTVLLYAYMHAVRHLLPVLVAPWIAHGCDSVLVSCTCSIALGLSNVCWDLIWHCTGSILPRGVVNCLGSCLLLDFRSTLEDTEIFWLALYSDQVFPVVPATG